MFGAKGFEGASIAEITQRAGVALGTFYVYFPDKESVFVELVDELGARLRRRLSLATRGLSERLEAERAGLTAFFDFLREHRELYRIVRQAEFVDEAVFRRYYQRLAEGYAEALKGAMERGEVRRVDPECLAYCLMGIGDFLGMRWVLWSDADARDRVVEQAMAFIRHGLAPSGEPAPKRRSR